LPRTFCTDPIIADLSPA